MNVNIPEMVDGVTPGSASEFNKRFGAIASAINGGIDSDNLKDGAVTAGKLAADVFSKFYPVGSLYFNGSDATNPAALLGFGVWAAYGAGRVPVGYDGSQTEFNAVGKTGGAKTVSLTANQNGAHNHGVNDPGHAHNVGLSGSNTETVTNSRSIEWTTPVDYINVGTSTAWTGISIQNSGAGEAHENMPPYITVYTWIRTA